MLDKASLLMLLSAMPGDKYASIQNPRMYRALRRRGYDKTAAARISNARTPGRTVKAPNYGAKRGQTIAGRLVRGEGGRFAASGSAEATPREQRAEATRQARDQRRTQAQQAEADIRAQEDARIAAAPRKQRAALRRQIAVERRQRTVKRRDAENQARAQERENERQARAAEDAATPKKGGGGGKKKPTDDEKRAAAQQKRDQTANQTAQQVVLDRESVDALRQASTQGGVANDTLARLGLLDADGLTSDQGRRALAALERGDVRGYQAALQDARARLQREQARQRSADERASVAAREAAWRQRLDDARRNEKAAQTYTPPVAARNNARKVLRWRQQYGDAVNGMTAVGWRRARQLASGRPISRDIVARMASFNRHRQNAAVAPEYRDEPWRDAGYVAWLGWGGTTGIDWARGITGAAEKTISVFKDAAGADRWISLTTTAYEDRDNEIITTKGIRHAVTYGDVTGERGVLRFWHVPGLDLGACDFQATAAGDRILVESGTFYSPLHARVGRAMARKGWRMSPGFLHPQTEPYAATVNGRRVGLYDSPMIFERSGAPPNRASNLFSAYLTVKDNRMDETKKAALKELVGGNDELLAQLLAQIEQTDKTAQASGVAFKADGAEMVETEMVETEMAEDDERDGDAAIITAAEAQLIAQAVVEALAPMMAELKAGMDIEKKMSGYVNEMKGMIGGVAQKDDTRAQEAAALQAQIAELTKRLKTLEGDAPRSVQRDIGQPVTVTEAQAASIKAADGTQWTGLDSFLTGFGLNGAAR